MGSSKLDMILFKLQECKKNDVQGFIFRIDNQNKLTQSELDQLSSKNYIVKIISEDDKNNKITYKIKW